MLTCIFYQIGDLGSTAREVEEALETNFAMASKWGCILLLDEADIFLAERTREDYVRNGLVAGEFTIRNKQLKGRMSNNLHQSFFAL